MKAPFPKLPPGVYFNPTAEECVRDYLRPWKAGVRPATNRIINDVDIYSNSPAVLTQAHAPGFLRGHERKWFMLTNSTRVCGGKGGKARAKRDVATGGNWKVEQRSKGVADEKDEAGDDPPAATGGAPTASTSPAAEAAEVLGKKDAGVKTPWLMEELTTEEDEAASATGWKGNMTIKVFCKLYVSPRASNEEKLQIFGEDRVSFDRDGKTKTVREALPEDLFDAVVASFYQAQGHAPPPPPPPRVLGHQHGNGHAVLPPAPPRVPGHPHGNGHAVLPRGVPAHHLHVHGQAAPRHQIHEYYDGSGHQYYGGPPVHDLPYHQFHEASPGVVGNLYSLPAFAHLDPQQQQQDYDDFEMIHTEKKPRLTLTYESPPPPPPQQQQPQGDEDSDDKSSCVVEASTSQGQEQQGQCGDMDAGKVFQEEAEPVPTQEDIFAELQPLTQESLLLPLDDKPDLLMSEPLQGFDDFSLEDYGILDFSLGSLETRTDSRFTQ